MRRLFALVLRGSKRLGGFAASVILLAVASLLLMPATIGAAGLETWSSIVLAQALAQIVATFVGCGYGVNGPAVVATLSPDRGVSYYLMAQRTKFLAAVPCLALMIGAMFVIPNPNPVAGLVGGAPIVINAFSGIFFYIGRGVPVWYLLAETGPRAALMFAGAVSLVLGAPLLVGLALPVLGTALGIAISYITIRLSTGRPSPKGQPLSVSGLRAELRVQRGPAAASVLRGARDALPVLAVTAVAAGLVGAFGVFDRVQRQALGALAPMTSALQGWVPRRIAAENSARPALAAMWAGVAGSLVIVMLFALLGSPLIRWLSANTLEPSFAEVLLCGGVIATSILMQIISYVCLVPLGAIRGVILANVFGLVVIVVAIPVILSIERSVAYALGALLIGNVAQLIVQILTMRRQIVRGSYLRRTEG